MDVFMGKWKSDGLRELDFIKNINKVTLHKKGSLCVCVVFFY